MKRGWAAVVMGILATVAPAASAQPPPLVKVGTLVPEGSSLHVILKEMGEKWKQAPGGGAQLRFYAGGVLGDEPAMVQKMRVGAIQGGVFTVVGLAQIDPSVYCLTVPMMYRSYEELDYVWEKMKPALEKRFRQKGFEILNWADAGWVTFFSKEPVLLPDDLKRRKFFVWAGDNKAADLWKSAGYSPVPLASTDILPGLQTGLINTFSVTPLTALSFQWFALAPHMADLKWQPLPGATIVAAKVWGEIPAELRPLLEQAAAAAGGKLQARIDALNDQAVDAMRQRGLSITHVTPEMEERWQAIVRDKGLPVFVGTHFSRETLDAVQETLRVYRRSRDEGKKLESPASARP